MAFIYVLGVILWVILAFWPAVIAKRKGYSFALFLIIALIISWLIALVIAILLKDKNETSSSRANEKAAEAIAEKQEKQA